jgi:hypothetical protein
MLHAACERNLVIILRCLCGAHVNKSFVWQQCVVDAGCSSSSLPALHGRDNKNVASPSEQPTVVPPQGSKLPKALVKIELSQILLTKSEWERQSSRSGGAVRASPSPITALFLAPLLCVVQGLGGTRAASQQPGVFGVGSLVWLLLLLLAVRQRFLWSARINSTST